MWFVNVVAILFYCLIISIYILRICNKRNIFNISFVLFTMMFEAIYIISIVINNDLNNFLQVCVLCFAYILPISMILLIKYLKRIKILIMKFFASLFILFKDLDSAEIIFEKVIRKTNSIKDMYKLAKIYLKNSKLKDARDTFFYITQIDNKEKKAYYELGVIFNLLEQKETAIIMLNNALKIDLDYKEPKEELAIIYSEQRRYSESIRLYKELLIDDKYNYMIYYNLANIYYEKQEIDEALSYYEKVVEINKKQYDAYIAMGNIYYIKEDFEMSKLMFEKALKISNKNPKANYNLSKIYCLIGEYEIAIKYLEVAVKADNGYIKKAKKDIVFENIMPLINKIEDENTELLVEESE